MIAVPILGLTGDSLDKPVRDNMRQLINLRWLAVAGQIVTILIVRYAMEVPLETTPMFAVIGALVALNLVSTLGLSRRAFRSNRAVFVAMLLDVVALSALLYLSGGATNPFSSLFLLQVVLGAMLLKPWSSWALVAATGGCFMVLVAHHRPLILPAKIKVGLFDLYILGALISFLLVAVLLVLFVTRINQNLRARDARLAGMRQQAVEEDHIVRMGLLASGAAHELGTPLSSLAVILNDWSHLPNVAADPDLAEELEEMQTAVARCKEIVSGILLSAGDPRGENPVATRLVEFMRDAVEQWRQRNPGVPVYLRNDVGVDVSIILDAALQQVLWNLFDNAQEAGATRIDTVVALDDDLIRLAVNDNGPGFAPGMLDHVGKPYHSTKGKRGGGLGLFLVFNVVRKLGGRLEARNHPGGGAVVAIQLPLSALELPQDMMPNG